MIVCGLLICVVFFFKQKTAYEMRISDWSSDVCSSDLRADVPPTPIPGAITSTTFPTIYMTDTGIYIDPRTGQADPALTAKDFTSYAAKAGFGRKGVTIGSRPGDAEAFMREMTAFFAREL